MKLCMSHSQAHAYMKTENKFGSWKDPGKEARTVSNRFVFRLYTSLIPRPPSPKVCKNGQEIV